MTGVQDKDILVSLSQVRAAVSVAFAQEHAVSGWSAHINAAVLDELRAQYTHPSMQRVRPSLVAFVLLMEAKLRKHDMGSEKPKPWNTQEASSVIEHFEQELREFRREIDIFEVHPFGVTSDMPHKASLEAADVANCLHVLVDKLNGCPYGPRGQGAHG